MFAQLDALETLIAKQKRIVAGLREFSDESEYSSPLMGLVTGITEACRTVVRSAEKALTTSEIKERIERLGIPEQKNLMASVHTILKRLIVAGDVTKVGNKYVWVTLGERLRAAEQK